MEEKPQYTGKPRGGAGRGQGRKPLSSKATGRTFRLSPEVIEILSEQKNQTAFVEIAIKHYNNFILSKIQEAEDF
ncbi:hypothetical protein SAMN04515674_105333 [Pseudarcicella hirudinis]|uniref:Uncharacterized protein n=1 Tax=Pseudarcicella hirudinis TaxID=1079859 RepID=A0A1I5T227_9BACT|nr:hypothetical protein [Pseudarcicella hirudinis]SFP77080.1 hypothetical protein SAMN04515674_105333 [Pseudarcicella hirudinis]